MRVTQVSSNSQLGTCVLEVALCLSQQLLDSSAEPASYAVGESVMARRMDGDFGEGTVLDTLDDGQYLVMMNDEDVAAKLAASELMPFGCKRPHAHAHARAARGRRLWAHMRSAALACAFLQCSYPACLPAVAKLPSSHAAASKHLPAHAGARAMRPRSRHGPLDRAPSARGARVHPQ